MKTRLTSARRLAVFLLAGSICLPAQAQTRQAISVRDPSQAAPAGGSGDSWAPILSPDGRYVLFASTANNLMLTTNNTPIPAVIPPRLNVFLRDRTNGTTTLVSVNLSGIAGGNGDSLPVDVSTNGRYAVFESSASDLVPGDTNNATDVFVRDLVNGATLLVSASTNGVPGNGASRNAAMTPDGRYVVFVSAANNLAPRDANGIPDIFVRDLQQGTTALVSVGAKSTGSVSLPAGSSETPAITPDGRYVAFLSTATNLVAGVPLGNGDIYLRDLVSQTTTWASVGASNAVRTAFGPNKFACFNLAVSDDGQYVAYAASPLYSSVAIILRYSLASGTTAVVHTNAAVANSAYDSFHNLAMTPDGRFVAFVANTNGPATCIQLWDASTGTSILASGDLSNSVPAGSFCDWPVIDPSGRFIAFVSSATNLVTIAVSPGYHLYVRDVQQGITTLVDTDTNVVSSLVGPGTLPSLSADGRWVAFDAADGGLVPNDRNRGSDVFVSDWLAGATELISARHPALPSLTPNGLSTIGPTAASQDGRYVAFASDADNLVSNDTNGCRDIFVRDLANGTNVLVSVATNGFSADGSSTDAAISPDGRFVAFTSTADNLVAIDTNRGSGVFVRDLEAGTTTLESVSTAGKQGNQGSYSPTISTNGRFVLFRSLASNLVPGVASGENLFLRDRQAGTTVALTGWGDFLAAMTPDGRFVFYYNSYFGAGFYVWDAQAAQAIYTNSSATCSGLAISADGRRLAFASGGSLYAADLSSGTNRLIDSDSSSNYRGLQMSGDGRFVAGVKAPTTGGTNQVYLYDLQMGTNLIVSHNYGSLVPANGASDVPVISADGRFVAYRSAATDLVVGVTNGLTGIFLYDAQAGANTLLTAGQNGNLNPDRPSMAPAFSGDGRTLFFESWASNLTDGDFNQAGDLFAFTFLYAVILPGGSPGEGPWLSWPWVPGTNYRVQYKDGFGDNNWHDLNATVTHTGNQAWLQDPAPGAVQRLYRIVTF